MQYSQACLCLQSNETNESGPRCQNVFDAAFPTLERNDNMKSVSPRDLCDRQKRDVYYSDDPTEEDIYLFQQPSQLQPRFKREVPFGQVSKDNGTRYCSERISETEIGKLCAKVGVDVQSLVNTCSADVEVSRIMLFRIAYYIS